MRTFHGEVLVWISPAMPHQKDNGLRVTPESAHKLLHVGLVYYCPMCDGLHVSQNKTIQSIHDFLKCC